MRDETLAALAHRAGQDAELVIGEGVMGLFDGAADGSASTAALSAETGWPVILVVDAHGMAASAAALVHGYATYRPETRVAGVIFNRVGSRAHGALLAEACAPLGIAILGALPRADDLVLPDRHLGLVQAVEHPDLEAYLDRAAAHLADHLDLDRLAELAAPLTLSPAPAPLCLPPLGQRIAVAEDEAFAFTYPFVLDGWRAAGAEISVFSPLADQAPGPDADAIYLPGGYPELHAGRLAGNMRFLEGLRAAAARQAVIYGECGGYMVLGKTLVDATGNGHAMVGLLPVETSFADPRLNLGYREAQLLEETPLGPVGSRFRGHEFHYARVIGPEPAHSLFTCVDARRKPRGRSGVRAGSVIGSFMHLIESR